MSSQAQPKEYDQIVQNTIMNYLNELREYEAKARSSLTCKAGFTKKSLKLRRGSSKRIESLRPVAGS
jgi:hypothetical protein